MCVCVCCVAFLDEQAASWSLPRNNRDGLRLFFNLTWIVCATTDECRRGSQESKKENNTIEGRVDYIIDDSLTFFSFCSIIGVVG